MLKYINKKVGTKLRIVPISYSSPHDFHVTCIFYFPNLECQVIGGD